jgi:hypothetical protein
MIRNLGTNRILWLLTASLSLVAALVGVFMPDIYGKVIDTGLMPGIFGQDLMTILASVSILLLTLRVKDKDTKKQLVVLGIIGYLFYAYGIYVIERVYTLLYFLYMAIFGLSFWSMVYGVAKIRRDNLQTLELPKLIRNVSVGFSLLVALVFDALWLSQLLPLLQAGQKIEFLYSVYILDLCFIMPAFIIAAIMLARKQVLGLLLTPALFVLGFTLIFSLAVSEMVKPLYGLAINAGGVLPSLVLSILFLILAIFYLRNLQIKANLSA